MTAIKRNVVWLLLSQGATWGVSILSLFVVPNQLGGQLFGELSFTVVYVGVLMLGPAPLFVQILTGALAYAVASLAVKTVSFEDARELRSSIRRRGGLTVGDDVPASSGLASAGGTRDI